MIQDRGEEEGKAQSTELVLARRKSSTLAEDHESTTNIPKARINTEVSDGRNTITQRATEAFLNILVIIFNISLHNPGPVASKHTFITSSG